MGETTKKMVKVEEKVELIKMAIKQLLIDKDDHIREETIQSLAAVENSDGEARDRRLLFKLLAQLETVGEDDANEGLGKLGIKENPLENAENEGSGSSTGNSDSNRDRSDAPEVGDEIRKELRKVRKQNFITHCLLSALIVLTVAWQLSEVSLVLQLKDGLTHPLRSFGNIFSGMMKKVQAENGGGDTPLISAQKQVAQAASSLPGLNIPEMPPVDFSPFQSKDDDD